MKIEDHRYWRIIQQPTKFSLLCWLAEHTWFGSHSVAVNQAPQPNKVQVDCERCGAIWHWVNEKYYEQQADIPQSRR